MRQVFPLGLIAVFMIHAPGIEVGKPLPFHDMDACIVYLQTTEHPPRTHCLDTRTGERFPPYRPITSPPSQQPNKVPVKPVTMKGWIV